jgi:hypothetical protein
MLDGLGFDVNNPATALTASNGVALAVWTIIALIAAVTAPTGRRWEFFFASLLLLGPLGVHAALIAGPRLPR